MVWNIPKSLSLTLVIMNGQVAFWNILGKQEEYSKKPLAYSWPSEYSHCQKELTLVFLNSPMSKGWEYSS
jgi:hypothetical protein